MFVPSIRCFSRVCTTGSSATCPSSPSGWRTVAQGPLRIVVCSMSLEFNDGQIVRHAQATRLCCSEYADRHVVVEAKIAPLGGSPGVQQCPGCPLTTLNGPVLDSTTSAKSPSTPAEASAAVYPFDQLFLARQPLLYRRSHGFAGAPARVDALGRGIAAESIGRRHRPHTLVPAVALVDDNERLPRLRLSALKSCWVVWQTRRSTAPSVAP